MAGRPICSTKIHCCPALHYYYYFYLQLCFDTIPLKLHILLGLKYNNITSFNMQGQTFNIMGVCCIYSVVLSLVSCVPVFSLTVWCVQCKVSVSGPALQGIWYYFTLVIMHCQHSCSLWCGAGTIKRRHGHNYHHKPIHE